MSTEHRLPTSTEIIKAHLRAADLADRRRRQMLKRRDPAAAMWDKASQYFFYLATQTAQDDAWVASLQDGIERLRDDRRLTDWTLAALELCLGHLSGVQRICYELVECGPADPKDVGNALGLTPSQVRQHVMRARQTMKRVRDSVAHLIPPKIFWYLQRQAS